MPIVIIDKFVIDASDQFNVGHVMTRAEANVLNLLWAEKLLSVLQRWHSANPDADASEVRAEAERLRPLIVLDIADDESNATITAEAIEIAKERILARLTSEGLPAPPGLSIHAAELAKDEQIQRTARIRVEARLRAGATLISRSLC